MFGWLKKLLRLLTSPKAKQVVKTAGQIAREAEEAQKRLVTEKRRSRYD